MNEQQTTKIKIKSFTDLYVWQDAHVLVLEIYRITKKFPRDEQFGLTNQIRRAAVSITSNIAEGFGGNSYREKSQFYSIASGSLAEVQSQLFIARDIQYLTKEEFFVLADRAVSTSKLLNGLIKKSKTMIHDS